jgi:hypothetical protein
MAGEFFERRLPLPSPRHARFVSPEEFERHRRGLGGREKALLDQLGTLLPYVTVNRLFDSSATDALLARSGIRFPRFEEYAENVFDYCLKTHWGKGGRKDEGLRA